MKNSYHEIELDRDNLPTARAPRGARLPAFIGGAEDAGEKLGQLRVTVVGVGSVGGVVAADLARLQVREINLVDSGVVKDTSILTHMTAFPEDVGHPKASTLGRRVKELSPDTRVRVFDGPIADLGLKALASADLVVLALDNLEGEISVSNLTRIVGLPLVQASVHGESMTVQVRFFGNDGETDGPCVMCFYGEAEFEALNSEVEFSCEHVTMRRETPRITGPVTSSTSFICALAAQFAMAQIIRYWLGLGRQDQVQDTMVEHCCYTHSTTVYPLKRKAACPGQHEVYRRVPSSHAIGCSSPRQLLMTAGLATNSNYAGVSLWLDEMVFAERSYCGCNISEPRSRFFHVGQQENQEGDTCGCCGQPVKPQPFYTFEWVPFSLLEMNMDRSLAELGAAGASYAMVRGNRGGVVIGL